MKAGHFFYWPSTRELWECLPPVGKNLRCIFRNLAIGPLRLCNLRLFGKFIDF